VPIINALAKVFVLLPWLNPFTFGPSPAVVPLLFSSVCAVVLLAGSLVIPSHVLRDHLSRATATAWLLAALFSSLMGLLQYFGETAVFGVWVNSAGMGEAFANLRQRNQFATLTNIGLAALLWWLVQGKSLWPARRPAAGQASVKTGQLPWVWGGVAVLLAMGNAASSSRTGLLQLFMLMLLAWWWCGKQGAGQAREVRVILLAAALAYVVAVIALPRLAGLDPNATGMLARLQAGDPACASRLTLWGNVLHLIMQKPWLGWGWGNLDYAHFITLYPGARFCDILDNAHNLPLHLAVELGLPVALLVCGVGLWLVWRAQPWREADPTRQLAWSVLAVILLHSLLEYPLWYGPFQMAFGLSVWMLWRVEASSSKNTDAFRPVARILFAQAAIFLIAFIAYAAWDYHRISQIYLVQNRRAAAYQDNTLEKIQGSWLFKNQVRFAELTTTSLTPANAAHVNSLAKDVLHFSPEGRVIEKLVESAVMLGRDDEALYYLARYRAAFPDSHARWAAKK
jgi:O-antigen ligase